MKIAILDLGTNTFNLLIAEVFPNEKFKKIYSDRIPVKLGEGSINKGYISEIPFNRGIDALKTFRNKIDEHKVKIIKAIATSAIRSAANGKEFTEKAYLETQINIEIIDGNREAELIFKGAEAGHAIGDSNVLIMDIGGGSTEFIIAEKGKLIWKASYPLGAARLIQKFQPEDPILTNTINTINNHLTQELSELRQKIDSLQPKLLIGTSGAFDSFVDMLAAEKNQPGIIEDLNSYEIDLNDFNQLYKKIITSSHEDRKQIKGLIPMRVDMIVVSFLLAQFIIKNTLIERFYCCTYSLKEGALIETIQSSQH